MSIVSLILLFYILITKAFFKIKEKTILMHQSRFNWIYSMMRFFKTYIFGIIVEYTICFRYFHKKVSTVLKSGCLADPSKKSN